MPALDLRGAKLDRSSADKSERPDDWEVTFTIRVDPNGAAFPDELIDSINTEWLTTIHRRRNRIGGYVCEAEIEDNFVRFIVPKSKVKFLESSVDEIELLIEKEVTKYLAKRKREANSEEQLDEVLERISKKE